MSFAQIEHTKQVENPMKKDGDKRFVEWLALASLWSPVLFFCKGGYAPRYWPTRNFTSLKPQGEGGQVHWKQYAGCENLS